MLSPARPGPIWSTVASCLAATTGWLNAVWTWRRAVSLSVLASRRGGPRHRLEHALVEVGLAAVADPAGDREHEVDADPVGDPGQPEVVLPGPRPALRDGGDGQAAAAVGREQAEAEVVGLEHRDGHGWPPGWQVSRVVPGWVRWCGGDPVPRDPPAAHHCPGSDVFPPAHDRRTLVGRRRNEEVPVARTATPGAAPGSPGPVASRTAQTGSRLRIADRAGAAGGIASHATAAVTCLMRPEGRPSP